MPKHLRPAIRHEIIQLMGFSGRFKVNMLREASRFRKTPLDQETEGKLVKIFRRYGVKEADIWGDDISYTQ